MNLASSKPENALIDNKVVRRGFMAAGAAMLAGLLMKETSRPAEAAGAMQYSDTTSTLTNTETGPTVLIDNVNYTSTSSVFTGQALNGNSVCGIQGVNGLRGVPTRLCGVYGETGRGGTSVGVFGDATGSSGPTTIGVYGKANEGIGVAGSSMNGDAVQGIASSGIGVHGISDFQPGVLGFSGTQPGVHGESIDGLGVRGKSAHFVGVVGISTGSHGLYGSTSAASAIGLVSENTSGGLAGYFTGGVEVHGSFQVFGAKNAVIKMQDGTNAAVYCQESPEPYFEDFGRAQLQGGVAHVAIEPEFAQLIAGRDYMVFLTPEGLSNGLCITNRNPAGFEVRDANNPASTVSFAYRMVTRRKDIEGKRFARVSDEASRSVAVARAGIASEGPGSSRPNSAPLPTSPSLP